MINYYYTPEQIAFYLDKHQITEQNKISLINNIIKHEKEFIHPEYINNSKLFLRKTLEYSDYLSNKEELDKEQEKINKDMQSKLGTTLDNKLSNYFSLNYFFIDTRLQLLFTKQKYIIIKFRTLLKNFGYKKKTDKILNHINKCMNFYHIHGYHKSEEINIFNLNLDDMITFKIINKNHIDFDDEKNFIKTNPLLENIEKSLQKLEIDINKIYENKSVTLLFNGSLTVNLIVESKYIKTIIHISPNVISEHLDNRIHIYLNNNHSIMYIHEKEDIDNFMEVVKNCVQVKKGIEKPEKTKKKQTTKTNNKKIPEDFLSKNKYVGKIYKKFTNSMIEYDKLKYNLPDKSEYISYKIGRKNFLIIEEEFESLKVEINIKPHKINLEDIDDKKLHGHCYEEKDKIIFYLYDSEDVETLMKIIKKAYKTL